MAQSYVNNVYSVTEYLIVLGIVYLLAWIISLKQRRECGNRSFTTMQIIHASFDIVKQTSILQNPMYSLHEHH